MDATNPLMPTVEVTFVIGANDAVKPAAAKDPSGSIYRMPIIEARYTKTVFILKCGQDKGFNGLVNKLFTMINSRMIFGDAKATISALSSEMKGS